MVVLLAGWVSCGSNLFRHILQEALIFNCEPSYADIWSTGFCHEPTLNMTEQCLLGLSKLAGICQSAVLSNVTGLYSMSLMGITLQP